jgi:hypothetical protein
LGRALSAISARMKGEVAIYVNEGFTMTVESPARDRS